MEMYQHDSSTNFRIVLRGGLAGPFVQEVEHAWNAVKSTLNGKKLLIDISGLTKADASGIGLLGRMHQSGAQVHPEISCGSTDGLLAQAVAVRRSRKALNQVLRRLWNRVVTAPHGAPKTQHSTR